VRPSPLLDDAGREFADVVRRFALEQLDDPGLRVRERAGEFWEEGWRRCAQMGLCGLPAPVEHGGAGTDRVTTAAALEALGYGCADGGLVFSINAHLWSAVVPLWQYGSDAQRAKYLGKLCRGEWVGLHAMTEPESGSDAFGLATTARREGDGFVLRGRKALITNAPLAGLFIVFARSPGSEGPLGVTAFVLEASTAGLEVGPITQKLGLRTSPMAELALDDVRVTGDSILGREGRGARIFGTSMEWERSLIMASQLGVLERALEEAVEYARSRHQFGAPIGSFQSVANRLSDTRAGLDAARAIVYEAAWRYDNGESDAAVAAAAKLVATETVVRAALDLLQVHGGHGYTDQLSADRRLRDALGSLFYSGTSDMMRRIVSRSLGL